MTEMLEDGTVAAESADDRDHLPDRHSGAIADLRRTGINPNFWYPVAVSGSVRKKKTFAATFAGERIALYRGDSGTVYALEDRCAHRQIPLSMGVVEGDTLRCCYHAWAYRGMAASPRYRICPGMPPGRRAASGPIPSGRLTAWYSSSREIRRMRPGQCCPNSR